MAIYHFSAKVISRANGSSAVASAAYRSASQLPDERLGRNHDFSNKAGVIHSEVLLPEGAPEVLADRATLWNAVERGEKRKDAQLARDIEFAIPRELTLEQGVELAREFVVTQFVVRGMVADLNVHWDFDEAGLAKPHAHVMLAMRSVDERGFGPKVREWNSPELLKQWREAWATLANQRLAELDIDARIDHRTLEAQGIALEPQHKIGPAGARRGLRGEEAERADDHARIARDNGTRIIAEPAVALDAITRGQATFTVRDLARFVHRHSDGKGQFDAAMGAVRMSPELVALGQDGRGEERFTSRDMIAVEARLDQAATALAGRESHGVSDRHRVAALAASEGRGLLLSAEQRHALLHVTGEAGLASVIGYAGSGKSAMLGVAREAWAAAGYNVRGAALSGIAAENLEGAGISSRTIASLEHAWGRERELLGPRDVLVIDEAGMIGTRQLERVLSAASAAGAKVVLVGDPEQLQAIEAGAAFRSVAERHGWQEITTIRRQHADWQREATRQLATGRTAEAVHGYGERGMVHAAETRESARSALVDGWERARQAEPEKSRIILTHTNAEVRDLNELVRERRREGGGLGQDIEVATTRGAKCFAAGDRLMFLKNERGLGGHVHPANAVAVKNGTLGTVVAIESGGERLTVRLDGPGGPGQEPRDVTFYTRDYTHIDHGYAATFHKSQGVTVDQTHILATPGMDRHSAYVGLSRHRDSIQLHYGRDDFADQRQLVRTLSRERTKDMASDYALDRDAGHSDGIRAFADRREIRLPEPSVTPAPALPEAAPVRARAKGMFAGFRPKPSATPAPVLSRESAAPAPVPDRIKAVERFARAVADMQRMTSAGLPVLPHQEQARGRAGEALDRLRPDGARDLLSAFTRDPGLIGEVVAGRTKAALQAMAEEGRVRTDPELRANRFVEAWRVAEAERDRLGQTRDYRRADQAEARLTALSAGLARDPQMLAVLRDRVRRPEPEISRDRRAQSGPPVPERERLISRELGQAIEPERMRGHDLGR